MHNQLVVFLTPKSSARIHIPTYYVISFIVIIKLFFQYDCQDGSDEQNCPDAQQNGTIQLPNSTATTALPPIFGNDFYPGGTSPNDNNGTFFTDDQQCPTFCPQTYEPVCGSDGYTYNNECEVDYAKCNGYDDLYIASSGKCQEEDGSEGN